MLVARRRTRSENACCYAVHCRNKKTGLFVVVVAALLLFLLIAFRKSPTKAEVPSAVVARRDNRKKLDDHQNRKTCAREECGFCPWFDVVFSYVDDTDPMWRREFGKAWRREELSSDASFGRYNSAHRFRDWGELRYALRAVFRHLRPAPPASALSSCDDGNFGFRRVFLVVALSSQVPNWLRVCLNGFDKACVTVVTHKDLMHSGSSSSPSLRGNACCFFNPNAIEARLHTVPGLLDDFLYFNNDMILGRRPAFGELFLVARNSSTLSVCSYLPPPPRLYKEETQQLRQQQGQRRQQGEEEASAPRVHDFGVFNVELMVNHSRFFFVSEGEESPSWDMKQTNTTQLRRRVSGFAHYPRMFNRGLLAKMLGEGATGSSFVSVSSWFYAGGVVDCRAQDANGVVLPPKVVAATQRSLFQRWDDLWVPFLYHHYARSVLVRAALRRRPAFAARPSSKFETRVAAATYSFDMLTSLEDISELRRRRTGATVSLPLFQTVNDNFVIPLSVAASPSHSSSSQRGVVRENRRPFMEEMGKLLAALSGYAAKAHWEV